jgi:hypothetical protein
LISDFSKRFPEIPLSLHSPAHIALLEKLPFLKMIGIACSIFPEQKTSGMSSAMPAMRQLTAELSGV